MEITGDIWFRCFGVVPNTAFLAGALADARWGNGRGAAVLHSQVVAANITALITGEGEPTAYQPDPPAILLPLGLNDDASKMPGQGVVGAEVASRLKGAPMMTERFAEILFGTGTF